MSVRRLAPPELQPKEFSFTADNLAWAKTQIAKYPAGRQASAVIPLLWRAQEQAGGWLPQRAIEYVADFLGMANIRVLEVATFYTMFQLSPVGRKAHVQVCGTTPCMLRGAQEIRKVCERRIHPEPFHVSTDGNFSWEEVECLGACVNAPMVLIWDDTYEDLTPESFEKVLDGFVNDNPVKPGPQIDRIWSAPVGGPTTLTDPTLYGAPEPANEGPSLTDVAPKKLTPEANLRDAPAPVETLAEAAAKEGVSATATRDAVLEPAVSEEHKPALLQQPRAGVSDDLKLIWGVGPKLEAMLHRMGVFHFDQIASWTEMNLRWVDQNLEGFRGRAVRDKWVEQAKKLATGWRPASNVGEKAGD